MGSIHGTNVAEEHGIRRSSHWPTVEKHFLASHPKCIACSPLQDADRRHQNPMLQSRGLQVHHALMPFHFCILLGRPDLEFDPRNLVVLCEDEAGVKTEDHHILIGHSRNFRSYTPDAAGVAGTYNGWSKERLLQDAGFLALCSALPPVWDKLSESQRQDLRKMLDQKLPKV